MSYRLKTTWTIVSTVTTHLLSYGTHKVTIDLSKSTDRTFLFLTIQHLNKTVITQGQSLTTLDVHYVVITKHNISFFQQSYCVSGYPLSVSLSKNIIKVCTFDISLERLFSLSGYETLVIM